MHGALQEKRKVKEKLKLLQGFSEGFQVLSIDSCDQERAPLASAGETSGFRFYDYLMFNGK